MAIADVELTPRGGGRDSSVTEAEHYSSLLSHIVPGMCNGFFGSYKSMATSVSAVFLNVWKSLVVETLKVF